MQHNDISMRTVDTYLYF